MIDATFIQRIRKIIVIVLVVAVGVLGIIAAAAFVLSSGVTEKPMQYRKTVPLIRLAPGQRQTVEFESFCLDNRRGSPRSGDAHSLMKTPAIRLRPYLREIFDEYLSHPARWKQYDVQQAVWYTEGHKKWDTLSPDQRRFIETATGKTDPVRGNPVIFLSRIYTAFGTVVKTNVLLALLALLVAVFAMPNPRTVIGRSLSWLTGPRLSGLVTDGRAGQWLADAAANEKLIKVQASLDVIVTKLVFKVFKGTR